MVYFKDKPPWEIKMGPMPSREEMERKTDASQEIKKKEMAKGRKWANWERGRKKALRERRDYFRANPDKKDDFGGV